MRSFEACRETLETRLTLNMATNHAALLYLRAHCLLEILFPCEKKSAFYCVASSPLQGWSGTPELAGSRILLKVCSAQAGSLN